MEIKELGEDIVLFYWFSLFLIEIFFLLPNIKNYHLSKA
jgi:hypothetical protein